MPAPVKVRYRTRRQFAVVVAAALVALSMLGGGTALASNTRIYSVAMTQPSAASAGASTTFSVSVISADNQTIANMVVTIPLPTGVDAFTATYGQFGSSCTTPTTSTLTCNLGNLAAFETRSFSVVAQTTQTTSPSAITFTASAQTNNENGTNLQVQTASKTFTPSAFDPNAVVTFDLNGGTVSTAALGTTGAGNSSTALNLKSFGNNGLGNSVTVQDLTTSTQPAICIQLKLTCQPDYSQFQVDSGATVIPYLETTITFIPTYLPYNIKKAFVIHLLDDGSLDAGFPLYNTSTTSCVAHPNLLPCADFYQPAKNGPVTIVMHTLTNGKGFF